MKYAVISTLHPDNEKPILLVFRGSSFVPTNIPIMAILALLKPTVHFFPNNFIKNNVFFKLITFFFYFKFFYKYI